MFCLIHALDLLDMINIYNCDDLSSMKAPHQHFSRRDKERMSELKGRQRDRDKPCIRGKKREDSQRQCESKRKRITGDKESAAVTI